MPNVGQVSLGFAIVIVAIVALAEWWRLRNTGPKLALLEFRTSPTGTANEFLYIRGRRKGLLAWILSLFGLHSQTSFSASDDEIVRETAGPNGFNSNYAPLVEMSLSRCSYYRAFSVLVLSCLFYLYGLWTFVLAIGTLDDYQRQRNLAQASSTLWACLTLGTLVYIWYALSKRVLILVFPSCGESFGISFKRSVIENKVVELRTAMEAVDLMNSRILAKKKTREEN